MAVPTILSDGTVLIPHLANWDSRPVGKRNWRTGIGSGLTTAEDRQALRQTPVHELEWSVMPFDVAELERLQISVRAAKKAGAAAAPWWGRGMALAAPAEIGDSTITIESWIPAAWLPVAGDLLIWFGEWSTARGAAWFTMEVQSVVGHVITLVDTLPQRIDPIDLVWPLIRGEFEADEVTFPSPIIGEHRMRIRGPVPEAPVVSVAEPEEFRVYWGRCGRTEDSSGSGLYFLAFFAFQSGVSVAPHHNNTELRTSLARDGGYSYSATSVPLTVATQISSLSIVGNPWTRTQAFPKFNTALGTLQEIELTIRNLFQTTPRIESLDAVPHAVVTVGGTATELLKDPGANVLLTSVATRVLTGSTTAYDGTTDFSGPGGGPGSGFSSPPISSFTDAVRTLTAADGALFTQFIGAGNITLTVASTAVVVVTGPTVYSSIVSLGSGTTTTRKFKYKAPDGYWWFCVEVLSGWDPISFVLASDSSTFPMASQAEMGSSFQSHGFGYDIVTDTDGKDYRMYRSRDEVLALASDAIFVT